MDESPKLLDLHQIHDKLRSLGAEDVELYAELRRRQTLDVWDRVHHVRSTAERGLSIACRKGDTHFRFQCGTWDLDSVLKLIEGRRFLLPNASQAAGAREKVSLSAIGPTAAPRSVTVLNLARAAFALGQGRITGCEVFFVEEQTDFWVSHSEEDWKHGSHSQGSLRARWKIEDDRTPPRFHEWNRTALDVQALVDGLKSELFEAVKKSVEKKSAWPAPQGELPIYWSAQALAKIALPFVRAFEADLFLKHESFLNETEFPALWPLELRETVDIGATDLQGTPRAAVTLLKNGKPRGLACDRKSATEMQVEATGHARRQGYRGSSTTGLWNIVVDFAAKKEELLECSPWGIWIDDVNVLDSSTKSGVICIEVKSAHLLHEKVRGEAIEPVVFEMAVQDFMGVVEAAGEKLEKFGFEIQKDGQTYVTELQVPQAFTPRFPYPGTVPADTYW